MRTVISEKNRRASKGFSTLELLLVVFVLGLASSLTLSAIMRATPNARFALFTDQLAHDLKQARSASLSEPTTIEFFLTDQGYRIDPLNVSRTKPVSIAIESAPFKSIVFEPGGWTSGGELTVTNLNRRSKVVVAPFSGRVSIAP